MNRHRSHHTGGVFVTPHEFVRFGEKRPPLGEQIATRSRSMDFSGLAGYLPNPDPVLKKLGKDIKAYRDLRALPEVGGNIRRRKAAVRALEWGLDRDKAKSRHARLVEDVFARLDMKTLIGEALEAAFYGYQPMEIVWGEQHGAIVPVKVIAKPPEWFVFSPENALRFRSRANMIQGEELPPCQFLLPRQDASYDNPYGISDLSMCFWPATFLRGGLKFWVTFTEKYGMPWIIGKYAPGTPPKDVDELSDRLEDMVQDAVAVVPDDASVEIVEATGKAGSAEVYERLLMFCRSEINIALLGQNQTTESNSNRASAQAGLQVTDDIRDGDAEMVCSAVNQLIRWVIDRNFGEHAEAPVFSMWEQEEVNESQANRDKTLSDAGLKFSRKYWMRVYNLQEGDLDEGPQEPAAAFAEADPAAFPEQVALDEAVDGLAPTVLQSHADGLLQPALRALRAGASEDELLGLLAESYPQMSTRTLTEMLSRLLFAAELVGRISAQEDRA